MRYVLRHEHLHLRAYVSGPGRGADAEHLPSEIAITTITLAGLWFGTRKSTRRVAVCREVDAFLDPFDVLPFDRVSADSYARVRFDLERIGRPIGERDLLIASVALARDLKVVTHNLGKSPESTD